MLRDKRLHRVYIVLLFVVGLCIVVVFWLLGRSKGAAKRVDRPPATQVQQIRQTNRRRQTETQAAGVFGIVLSSAQTAVQGASVCASCGFPQCGSPGPARLSCTRTDAQGRYALKNLSSGRYHLFASARRYQTSLATSKSDNEQQLFTIDAAQRYEVDFTLQEGGVRVAGTVVDAMGGPIAEAQIAASKRGSTQVKGGITYSDGQGRFELFLETGVFVLLAKADGYASDRHSVTAPDESVEIVLTPASQLSGIVVSAIDGTPVPNVEVRATKFVRTVLTPGDGAAMSGADGQFTVEGLSDGDYNVSASSAGWSGQLSQRVRIRIADNAPAVRLEVRPGVSIKGTVSVQPRPEPCTAGMVSIEEIEPTDKAYGAMAHITSDGHVQLQGVPPGAFRVRIQCKGHRAAADLPILKVQTTDIEDIEWAVQRSPAIFGKVVDSSGRALAGKVISAQQLDQPNKQFILGLGAMTTDEQGAFSITGLSPTTYRVSVQGDPDTAQMVDLSDGNDYPSVKIVVRSAATIRVRVDAASAPKAVVTVQATNGAMTWRAQRTETDRYELHALPEGSYTVYVSDGLNASLMQTAELRAGQTADLSFTLPRRTATIRGRLVDENGDPLADVRLRARSTKLHMLSGILPDIITVLSDADGRFSIPNLVSTELYDLSAVFGVYNEKVLQRDVSPNQPVVLTLASRL